MTLVLAMQFHGQDRDRAMNVSRLIADIEPAYRKDVSMLMVAREDTAHDYTTVSYVAQKMPCAFFTTSTQWTGWPGGCNGMALDLLEESNRRVQSGEWANVLGLILLEPDACPVVASWINDLVREWTIAMLDNKIIMGAWRDSGGPFGHVNGVCCLRPDFADVVDLSVIAPNLAWDCALAPQLKDRWHITKRIRNLFQTEHATVDDLVKRWSDDPPVALVHGVKSDDCYEYARRVMGI